MNTEQTGTLINTQPIDTRKDQIPDLPKEPGILQSIVRWYEMAVGHT